MENKKQLPFKVFNFDRITSQPTYKPNKKDGFIQWGDKNDYPEYLMKMYNSGGSNIHKAIISRKIKLISGLGWMDNELVDKYKLDELALKLACDYEIYNAYAIEVIYTNGGDISSMTHIPVSKIRRGIQCKEINFPHFWVSKDWKQYKKEEFQPEFVREYNSNVRTGTQLFYFMDYNPEAEVYPIVEYSSTLNWIELDYEISKFHLNQAKNGYAPSFILNFATGIPKEEEIEAAVRGFKKDFKGTDGETLLITFSEGVEQKPTMEKIDLNDSDERFINLSEQIREKVFIGHQVTNSQLFGVMVPGSLGGKAELTEALDIFQSVYIDQRQRSIEVSVNSILGVKENKLELNEFTL